MNFSSGYSPDFIEVVFQTGASYRTYDKSVTINEKLQTNGISISTKEELFYYPLMNTNKHWIGSNSYYKY